MAKHKTKKVKKSKLRLYEGRIGSKDLPLLHVLILAPDKKAAAKGLRKQRGEAGLKLTRKKIREGIIASWAGTFLQNTNETPVRVVATKHTDNWLDSVNEEEKANGAEGDLPRQPHESDADDEYDTADGSRQRLYDDEPGAAALKGY